jgi:PmbA protein
MNMKKTAGKIFSLVKKYGGTAARFMVNDADVSEVVVRDHGIEKTDASRSVSFTLTVWVGDRSASVSGNDLSVPVLEVLVKQACEIAKLAEPDPLVTLAPKAMRPKITAEAIARLDLCDTSVIPTMSELLKWSLEVCSERKEGSEISSSSASVTYRKSVSSMFTTDGFELVVPRTRFGISAEGIAKRGDEMSAGWFSDGARHFSKLLPLKEIGNTAEDLAVRLLEAVPVETGTMPVVLSRMASETILHHFWSAVIGENVFKKRSFLKDRLNKRVFPTGIAIVDDPFIPGMLGSNLADSECTAARKIEFVKDGVLASFATDLKSAAKLGSVPTGHADGFNNLYMENGNVSPEELMAGIKRGIYVIDFLGQGPNIVTGDYSRGARGFLIEDGKITTPVNGITIAGNLADMFANLSAANDLELGRYNVPTLRIEGMTVAGE